MVFTCQKLGFLGKLLLADLSGLIWAQSCDLIDMYTHEVSA